MSRSIFDLAFDDSDNPVGRGRQYYVLDKNKSCFQIVKALCGPNSDGTNRCLTNEKCPEICDSAQTCANLKAGQVIQYNCNGAQADKWQNDCHMVTGAPTPRLTRKVPSGFKTVGWKDKYTCYDIVSEACKEKGGVNVTKTYKIKQNDAFCVTDDAWKKANDNGNACKYLKDKYKDNDAGIVQPEKGWRAWYWKPGDDCTGKTIDNNSVSGKIRRCPRIHTDTDPSTTYTCTNLQAKPKAAEGGFLPDQVEGMCGPN